MSYPRDRCQCGECGWVGPWKRVKSYQDSDGWEYPPYTVYICPRCNAKDPYDDGDIMDYPFSLPPHVRSLMFDSPEAKNVETPN